MIPPDIDFIKTLNKYHLKKSSKEIAVKILDFMNQFEKAVIQDFYIGTTDSPDNQIKYYRKTTTTNKFIVIETENKAIASEVKDSILKLDANGYCTNEGKYIYCYFIE